MKPRNVKDKIEKQATTPNEMTDVAAELRAFVATLKKRPDIVVETAKFGRSASKSVLAWLESAGFPQDLIDLYAEMNGIHVEWRFVEGPGGGCIRVQTADGASFLGDDASHMNFGK